VLRVDTSPLPNHGSGSMDKSNNIQQLPDTYAIFIPNIKIVINLYIYFICDFVG
jgi:hypothetical protein